MGLFTALAADASSPGPFVLVYALAACSALACAVVARWLDDDKGALSPPAMVADDGTEPVLQEQLVQPRAVHR